MFKEEAESFFIDNFPEINGLDIVWNEEKVQLDVLLKTIAYSGYINEKDPQNKIIAYFNKRGTLYNNLLPIFSLFGLFVRERDKVLSNTKFNDKELADIDGFFEGRDVKIRNIFFSSEELYASSSNTGTYKIPFWKAGFSFNSPSLKLSSILEDIEEFQRINDQEDPLFCVKMFKTYLLESGMLLFIKKNKFEHIKSSLRLNNKKITEIFNIHEIKQNSTGGFTLKPLSVRNYGREAIPILIIADRGLFKSAIQMKKHLKGLKHISSVFIDQFDEIKTEDLSEDIRCLKSYTESDVFSNVYITMNNSNFHFTNKFIETEVDYRVLFNSLAQRCLIENIGESSYPNYKAIKVKEEVSYNKLNKLLFGNIYSVLRQLQNDVPFHLVEIRKLKWELWTLYNRVTTFCDVNSLKNNISIVKSVIEDIMFRDEDEENKNIFMDFLNECEKVKNIKLNDIAAQLKLDKCEAKSVLVYGNNNNDDILFLKKGLKECLPNLKIVSSLYPSEAVYYPYNKNELGLFFKCNASLLRALMVNSFTKKQYVILSEESDLPGFKKQFRYLSDKVMEMSSFEKKRAMLLLDDDNNLMDDSLDDNINISDFIDLLDENEKQEENGHITQEVFFQDLYYNNQTRRSPSENYGRNGQVNVVVCFDDGSSREVDQNQCFYKCSEENIKELRDLKCKAVDLKEGDSIFLVDTHNDDFQEAVFDTIKKIPEINRKLNNAEKWREELIMVYEACQKNYAVTKRKINYKFPEWGFTEMALKKWINRDITLPQDKNIKYLLKYLNLEAESESIISDAKDIKALKLKIPRRILEYYFCQLNNLHVKDIMDSKEVKLIESFYSCLSIKNVQFVIK